MTSGAVARCRLSRRLPNKRHLDEAVRRTADANVSARDIEDKLRRGQAIAQPWQLLIDLADLVDEVGIVLQEQGEDRDPNLVRNWVNEVGGEQQARADRDLLYRVFVNLGRNAFYGPGFSNTDLSIVKNLALTGAARLQFRIEAFNVFNQANLGLPGRIASVGSTSFGLTTNTRFPTGDSGSARQVQLVVKVLF